VVTLSITCSPSPLPPHHLASYFYCGPAAYGIPAKLEAAIIGACSTAGKMSLEDATRYVENMKHEGRFVLEAF